MPVWFTVYGLFHRRHRAGIWSRVLGALRTCADAEGRIDWRVSVDSTITRTHQHAAGVRRNGHLQKEPPGGLHKESADRALGRSRGELTTTTIWPVTRATS